MRFYAWSIHVSIPAFPNKDILAEKSTLTNKNTFKQIKALRIVLSNFQKR